MELKVEYIPIEDIKPYENNAKLHPAFQIEQIKKSIQEFGNNDPVAVWHGEIVEGNGRYEALKQLGYTKIPVIRLDDLTDEQRRAYGLIHNKLTMNSDFDIDLLAEELDSIGDIDMGEFGLEMPGGMISDLETSKNRRVRQMSFADAMTDHYKGREKNITTMLGLTH